VAHGLRERPRSIPRLPSCPSGNDVVGARSSRPWTFSHSPPMGKSHATPLVVDVSRVVAIAGEAAQALDPGPPRQPSIALQRTSPAGALPPSKLRTDQCGPIGLGPARGRTYALAFFPSTPWTDANGLIPPCRQEIGFSHSTWLRCLSVHLIDKCLATEQIEGVVGNVSRFPYASCFPAWGKSVNSCGWS
jgi:hypothetical protein